MEKIVKNNSKGYGYNYASLSDIVRQGYDLPKMKTGTDPVSLRDYIYYYDEDLKEWLRGAEIVIPENVISKEGKPKMNKAQLSMSAQTYARRGTTLMALRLATDDDAEIENAQEEVAKATDKQIDFLFKLYKKEEIDKICEHYQVANVTELPKDIVSKYISDRNAKE